MCECSTIRGYSVKYDILNKLREHLYNKQTSKNTADRYYFAVVKLLKDLQFNNVKEIDKEVLNSKIASVSKKNNFSAVKNGLQALQEIEPNLDLPDENFFKSQSARKRNRTKKVKEPLILDSTKRKINSLKDNKYKLPYRIMLKTGLRVSEVSGIKKDDIEINNKKIKINVEKAKGGKQRTITFSDKYLAKKLTEYIGDKKQGNIFPAASTLKNKANELGIQCHDLRRIAAIQHKKQLKANGESEESANKSTKKLLGHEKFETTEIYLKNKKLKDKTEIVNVPMPEVYRPLFFDKPETFAEEQECLNKFSQSELNYFQRLIKAEPQITKDIQSIVEKFNGKMGGLEYRVKTPSSIYEKMHEREEKTKIKRMSDIIRYTGLYDINELAEQTEKTLNEFKNKDYEIKKIKNTWLEKNAMYRGINVQLVSPTGEKLEFQSHYQASFDLKNGELHRLYDKYRKLENDDIEKIMLEKQMIILSNQLPIPKNIERVK